MYDARLADHALFLSNNHSIPTLSPLVIFLLLSLPTFTLFLYCISPWSSSVTPRPFTVISSPCRHSNIAPLLQRAIDLASWFSLSDGIRRYVFKNSKTMARASEPTAVSQYRGGRLFDLVCRLLLRPEPKRCRGVTGTDGV
jgi:hypothetical protein